MIEATSDHLHAALMADGWHEHDVRHTPPGPLLILRDRRGRVLRTWTLPDRAPELPTLPGLYVHFSDDGLPVVLHHTRGGDWLNLADGQTHTAHEVLQLLPLDRLVDWDTAVSEVLQTAADARFLTEPLAHQIAEAIREGDQPE